MSKCCTSTSDPRLSEVKSLIFSSQNLTVHHAPVGKQVELIYFSAASCGHFHLAAAKDPSMQCKLRGQRKMEDEEEGVFVSEAEMVVKAVRTDSFFLSSVMFH